MELKLNSNLFSPLQETPVLLDGKSLCPTCNGPTKQVPYAIPNTQSSYLEVCFAQHKPGDINAHVFIVPIRPVERVEVKFAIVQSEFSSIGYDEEIDTLNEEVV